MWEVWQLGCFLKFLWCGDVESVCLNGVFLVSGSGVMVMKLFRRKEEHTELVAWDDDEAVVISLEEASVAADEGLQVECAWCWDESHPGEPFPEEATSTICVACQLQFFGVSS